MTFSSTADASGAEAATDRARGIKAQARIRKRTRRDHLSSPVSMPSYPYHVCRPHFLDRELPGLATLYLQSCSGGLFEDDKLACDVIAGTGSAIHLTSGASTIVHSSRRGGQAEHSTAIRAEQNAFAEYLPDPVHLVSPRPFDDAARSHSRSFCDDHLCRIRSSSMIRRAMEECRLPSPSTVTREARRWHAAGARPHRHLG